jgi:GntR family transcriptional regulator/MocR family aminotransferase
LDNNGRVIYIGTFSKVMFPAIRLAYLILPPDLVDAFVGVKTTAGTGPPIFIQAAAAEFIRQGHFARHIRRMRRLYHGRRDTMLYELKAQLGNRVEIGPADCGMHLTIWLPEDIDEEALIKKLPSTAYLARLRNAYITPPSRPGLVLSFAATDEEKIRTGVTQLKQALKTV